MAEPQPSTATEGMDDSAPAPASAEDRKTAAAMNALESSRAVDEDQENAKPASKIDAGAIEQAISRLELVDKAGKASAEDPNEERRKKREEEQKEKERRAKIKVSNEDVEFFMRECDMSKIKAAEFLRSFEGDFEAAVRGYIRMWAKEKV